MRMVYRPAFAAFWLMLAVSAASAQTNQPRFEKLGLKMKPDKAMIDTYAIESIQLPTEN